MIVIRGSSEAEAIRRAEVWRDSVMKVAGVLGADGFRYFNSQQASGPYGWGYLVTYDNAATDVGLIVAGVTTRLDEVGWLGAHEMDSVACFEPVEPQPQDAIKGNSALAGTKAGLTLGNSKRAADPNLTRWRPADVTSMRLEDWAGAVAGPTYLELNFQIPRSTLHRWQKRNQVIALRKGLGRHVFPLAQFVDGRPVPGIPDVFALAKNPRLAWSWLVHPSPHLGGDLPIDLLRRDLVTEVMAAARRSF